MPHRSLEEALRSLSREGELCEDTPEGPRCHACAHGCVVKEGKAGVCRVRFSRGGRLMVPFGYVAGLQADPIEKKPFFHVLPGSRTLSFGMLGCDFRCRFCQNWISSQALKDPMAGAAPSTVSADELVRAAMQEETPFITSTYNEPLISAEWAAAVMRKGLEKGLRGAFVSNGFATRRALEFIRPFVRAMNVDLKCFEDKTYKSVMGGALAPVLRTIEDLVSMGVWTEVVTLVVPGLNDSDRELRAMASFVAGVSKDIPWHVTAYHGDYKMAGPESTPPDALLRAGAIGKAEGLRYVYAGNLPGGAGDLESTFCPSCGKVLIERRGYRILSNALKEGRCPGCSAAAAGIWE